ncbi:hypothetical protein KAR91_20900 [Candidatus Pacearchaeota archaeon]|nr:hypothetical protein [Candidatus Pacearchaeota archaeon]
MEMKRRSFMQSICLLGVPVVKAAPLVRYNPMHESLQQRRLNRFPERIYAEVWKKRNVRQPYSNGGFTYLEWILCPDDRRVPALVSDRDAEVAASVIQWLGTNVGTSFVYECESKIKLERKREQDEFREKSKR